jgi:hypothetical protein
LSSWLHDQKWMRWLSDGDCSKLRTKLLSGQAAKTAQAIVIRLPMSLVPAVRRRGDQMSGTRTALGQQRRFQRALATFAIHPGADISLHRTK